MKTITEMQIETYELMKIKKPEFIDWYDRKIKELKEEMSIETMRIIEDGWQGIQGDLFDK